jgi:anti-sigma B factor antagonist
MSVTFSEEMLENGLLKMTLTGILDAPGAMSIEEQFQDRLKQQGGNVIIDLTGLEYMSSYGLRMLLMSAKSLRDSGGGLHLAGPSGHVMDVIKMAGYDTMFPIYETVDEAIIFLTG